VYKWVLANLILGVASIPSRGSRNTPSRFMLQKPEISTGDELMSHLAHIQTFTLASQRPLEILGSKFPVGLGWRWVLNKNKTLLSMCFSGRTDS